MDWINGSGNDLVPVVVVVVSLSYHHIISYVKFIVPLLHYIRPCVRYIVRRYKVELI